MPFGCSLLQDRTPVFRLWAPAVSTVELCLGERLDSPDRRFAMNALAEGWFELALGEARVGDRYFYLLDKNLAVPDPASRFQPADVQGPSQIMDPQAYAWRDGEWRGRPWEEAVIYEAHVGCFSPEGTFAGLRAKLPYLRELGITALELLPVADFPGSRNWGYDGVLPFAPDSSYGAPDELKALVDEAHAQGLMVFMDVVYNHFGPEGNYLHSYAPAFFNPRHQTPWGAALNFDGEDRHWVREYLISNALYWIEEFHMDGLRFDAVHSIIDADDSQPGFLEDLGTRLRELESHLGRPLHLVLENDHNSARHLRRASDGQPERFTAQWNDDLHHCLHLLISGEDDGYYADYRERLIAKLGRCLSEGFAYQGECSAYRDGAPRGEPSRHLPPGAFVAFLQNHDQVGNRALGERLSVLTRPEALHAATGLLLLAPQPPLLFMGQEWASRRPFLYFCDFHGELADSVREGRRQEFARFPAFAKPEAREAIPDPMDPQTFLDSKLNWEEAERPTHADWLALHRELLQLRAREIAPRLRGMQGQQAPLQRLGQRAFALSFRLGDGARLQALANLDEEELQVVRPPTVRGRLLWSTHPQERDEAEQRLLPPWSLYWYLEEEPSA